MVSGHKVFATVIGILLILRAMLGFAAGGKLFGILSASPDHNLLHLAAGTFYLWVGVWTKRTTAQAWNKFLGWMYAVIAAFGIISISFLAAHLNQNTWADNLFNVCVASSSLVVGYYGTRLKHKGINFLKELGWPFER